MDQSTFDVIVIGAGSAGLAAAEGVAAAGKRVAIVERDRYLGGECPNYGCIPTKSLLRAAKVYSLLSRADEFGLSIERGELQYQLVAAYKDHTVQHTGGRNLTAATLAERGVTLITGPARFVNRHSLRVGKQLISGRQFIIATGSSTAVPALSGLSDVPYLTVHTAINLKQLPQSIIIIGGGPIGVEYATIWNAFGADVTLVEAADRILPHEDEEAGRFIAQCLEERGVTILTNFQTESVKKSGNGISVTGEHDHQSHTLSGEQLMLATGMAPNVEGLNLDLVGVQVEKNGIVTDEHFRTTAAHIWAAGDVTSIARYTPIAHASGRLVAHNMTNPKRETLDLSVVPRCVYLFPELAAVGRTEQELKDIDHAYVVGRASIGSLGRALTDSEHSGFVKLLVDPETGHLLGATIVAERAGEMIHEPALAMKAKLPIQTITGMIHAFPTYSEAILVAAAEAESQLARS